MGNRLTKHGSRRFKCEIQAKQLLLGDLSPEAEHFDVSGLKFSNIAGMLLSQVRDDSANLPFLPTDPDALLTLFVDTPYGLRKLQLPTIAEFLYRLTVKDTSATDKTAFKPWREVLLYDPTALKAATLLSYSREMGPILGLGTLIALQFLCELPSPSEQVGSCDICGDCFGEDGEKPVQLPCGHIFGSECVAQWMSPFVDGSHNTCPMCRASWFHRPRSSWSLQKSSLAVLSADPSASLPVGQVSESDRMYIIWARIQDQLRITMHAFKTQAERNPHVTRLLRSDARALKAAWSNANASEVFEDRENHEGDYGEADDDSEQPMDLSD